MRQQAFLSKPGSAETMRRALKPAAGAYAIAVLWLGGHAVERTVTASQNVAAAGRDVSAAASARKRVADASQAQPGRAAGDMSTASALQKFVESQAVARGCTVAEFQASAETQPYLSKFSRETPPGPWQQVEVTFSVKGRLPQVFESLATLQSQAVPFEPNTVEIKRDTVSATGISTVVAHVQGRVLRRTGEVPK